MLQKLLADRDFSRVIVFTRTKHGANKVARHVTEAGVTADAIHGNKSQGARQRALDDFRRGRVRVLVATDIAARGIDVDGITHVINFDIPNIAESYVHRIGRTARAGADGIAISFCARDERAYLRDIERLTRQPLTVVGGQPAGKPHQPARPHANEQRKPHAHAHEQRRPEQNGHGRLQHNNGHARPQHNGPARPQAPAGVNEQSSWAPNFLGPRGDAPKEDGSNTRTRRAA